MAEIEKLDGKSMDIVDQNIEQLKELFPSVFSEGKIQFNQLEELLGNYVVEDEGHYNFTWHGKRKAGRLAQTPSTGTLRPCKEESVDWDNTENLFIEGDNLEVLKLLQKSYHRQVKMIYIDPPYNTGNDFVYEDDFKDGVKNYLEMTGQLNGDGKKVGTNSSAAGRIHTNWLNMLYPRLRLARNLLKDDGLIVIHIDENEYSNLNKLLIEVFGEENILGVVVWDKRNPKGKVGGVAQQHEYIYFTCKNKSQFVSSDYFYRKKDNAESMIKKCDYFIRRNNGVNDQTRREFRKWTKDINNNLSGGEKAYCLIDDNGDIYRPVSMAAPDKPETRSHRPLIHPITKLPCPVPAKGWRFTDESMDDLLKTERVLFGEDETTQPQRKYLLKENMTEAVSSLLYHGGSDNALGLPFDNPKPVSIAMKLIQPCASNNDIVMDFFAGSGTAAHAVMKLNDEDGANRKCISVQLPEEANEKSEAFKAGYTNIAEISKERIRRATNKIKEQNPDYNGDLGFKVFKLDSSNIKRWDADFDTLEQDLVDAADYLVEGRSDEDILYELCLKLGLDLSVKIEEKTVAGEKLFVLGRGYLVVCLSDNITMDLVNGLGALKDELAPEDGMRVVFKDDGFKDDVVKTNAVQTLKRFGIDDIKSL